MRSEIKIVDLDGAFDKRMSEYFSKHAGKYSEEEWEDRVSASYKKYGETYIESLGACPNEYYEKMNKEELAYVLKEHFTRGIGVDGFLRSALEKQENHAVVAELLSSEKAEEVSFAVDVLGADKNFLSKYVDILEKGEKNEAYYKVVEILEEEADAVKEPILSLYNKGVATGVCLDILSHTLPASDEVLDLLVNALLSGEDGVAVSAKRLETYGDERALTAIYSVAEREDLGYLDYRELSGVAEALGGQLAEKDFSSDKDYLALQKELKKHLKEQEKAFGFGEEK